MPSFVTPRQNPRRRTTDAKNRVAIEAQAELVLQLLRERWVIPAAARTDVVNRLLQMLDKENLPPKQVIKIARALADFDKINLRSTLAACSMAQSVCLDEQDTAEQFEFTEHELVSGIQKLLREDVNAPRNVTPEVA